MDEKKTAEDAIKEAKNKIKVDEKKTAEDAIKEAKSKIKGGKETKRAVNITTVIIKSTKETARAYKNNIDGVLGFLAMAFFAGFANAIYALYNNDPSASWISLAFDFFCSITMLVAKHRVKKGDLIKFFDMTKTEQDQVPKDFFTKEDEGDQYLYKFD
jgi:predicted RNA-binding protein Jag